MWRRLAIASFVVAIAVGASALVAVRAAPTQSHVILPCHPRVTFGVIPRWARAGFSGSPKMRYVLGRGREIAGLLFAYPLESPPPPGRDNKILWVVRHPDASGASLRIEAVRIVGRRNLGAPVQRLVDRGPGPSIINLPTPGCWRFSLAWAGHEDTLDLRYIGK